MKTRTCPFNIGEYQGFVLYDNAQVHSVEDLVVNPKLEELEQITHEYAFKLNQIQVGYNNLLLRVRDQNVLVDAGIRRPIGELCLALEDLKIHPGDIDTIVITHSDRDHIGGILDQQGEISFPKARYIILEDAWGYWTSEKERAELTRLNQWSEDKTQFIWETYSKVEDLIHIVKAGEEFIPGLKLYPAPGHRYDHSVLNVNSSDGQLMHIADALVHPLFMGNREWYSTYDANPTQAVDSKLKILNMCASEDILIFASHFPFPGLGYVQREGDRWKWLPENVREGKNNETTNPVS